MSNSISGKQHYADDTTIKYDQDKAWSQNAPGAQEAEGDIQPPTPTWENNIQGLGEQLQNKNYVCKRCPTWSSNMSLLSKLHAKDVEEGTCSERNTRQDQVTMERLHSS